MKKIFSAVLVSSLLVSGFALGQQAEEPTTVTWQILTQDEARLRGDQAQIAADQNKLDADRQIDNIFNISGDVQSVQRDRRQLDDDASVYARDKRSFQAQSRVPQ